MILACDQYEETIRLAWGEEVGKEKIEEYEELDAALLRIQELAFSAERISVIRDSSLYRGLSAREGTVSQFSRLEAVYCQCQKQVGESDCLILSLGQQQCIGGVIKAGKLQGTPIRTDLVRLYDLYQARLESNLGLKRAIENDEHYGAGQAVGFQSLLTVLKGQNGKFFLSPVDLTDVAEKDLSIWKSHLQDFLAKLDPQREIKTIICTDWAGTGSLAKLLEGDYQIVSTQESWTDAVRGMFLLGWRESHEFKKTVATISTSLRDALGALKRDYSIFAIAEAIQRAFPSGTNLSPLPPYLRLAEQWTTLQQQVARFEESRNIHITDFERSVRKEIHTLQETAEQLAHRYQPTLFLPLFEKKPDDAAVGQSLELLKNTLGIESFTVKTESEVTDLDALEVVQTKGQGERSIIETVVEQGYRNKTTGTIIQKPKVVIRREGSKEKTDSEQGTEEKTVRPENKRSTEEKKGISARDLVVGLVGAGILGAIVFVPPLWKNSAILPSDTKVPGSDTKHGSLSRPSTTDMQLVSPFMVPPQGKDPILAMISAASSSGGIDKEDEIFIAKRRIEEIRSQTSIPSRNSKEARKYNKEGKGHTDQKQWTEALQPLQAAYQADLSDVEIASNLGLAALMVNALDKAEGYLLHSLFLTSHYANSWLLLGRVYAKQGKKTDALACFANAYRFSLGPQGALPGFRKLTKDLSASAEEREVAVLALQLKFIEEEQAASQNLKEQKNREKILIHMMTLTVAARGVAKESAIFKQLRLLSSYNALNPLPPADDTLAEAEYKAKPSKAEILKKLVEVTEQKNDLPTAERDLISALMGDPGKSRTWEKLGRIYAKQGQKSYAVACLANAYRFSHTPSSTYKRLQDLQEKDDNPQVKQAAAEALQLEFIALNKGDSAPVVSKEN